MAYFTNGVPHYPTVLLAKVNTTEYMLNVSFLTEGEKSNAQSLLFALHQQVCSMAHETELVPHDEWGLARKSAEIINLAMKYACNRLKNVTRDLMVVCCILQVGSECREAVHTLAYEEIGEQHYHAGRMGHSLWWVTTGSYPGRVDPNPTTRSGLRRRLKGKKGKWFYLLEHELVDDID